MGVAAALTDVARTRPRLAARLQQLAVWRATPPPVSQLLETLAREVHGHGPDQDTDAAEVTDARDRRADDVAALVALARRWEADGGASLGEFLDTVALSEEDPLTSDSTQVLGLTLHAAKGLEFDTVVIVGAEDGLLPHYRHTVPEALAEERRLCYVGMTRARRRLVFSMARMRRLWGEVVFRPPSRFLREAGLDIQTASTRSVTTAPLEVTPVMSVIALQTTAERLPRVSPSRLEAWDRCPAAYRFEYVLRLPQPVADQTPRLLGSVAHALVEAYVREAQTTGTPPPLDRLPALARALLSGKELSEATTAGLARQAAELVRAWLSRWAVPLTHTVGVEHALAIDADGRRVTWDAPEAFLRGRLDLVAVEGRQATVCDWKSGWVTEDDETLPWAWAPGCYAALLWAWAPRLEAVIVEYHYLRTGRVARTAFAPADAAETLAWARTTAAGMAQALATPDDHAAFPPRPSTACATCPWVNRCPAGQAALDATDEAPIPDEAEARRLAARLLVGEARVGRLRERLRLYLQDREPLALDGMALGFFPTKGRYDPAAVFRAATEAGIDPWALLAADGRALATFLKRQPGAEQRLASAWTPSPPWFGHRKTKTVKRNAADPDRTGAIDTAAPETEPGPPGTPG